MGRKDLFFIATAGVALKDNEFMVREPDLQKRYH